MQRNNHEILLGLVTHDVGTCYDMFHGATVWLE